MAQLRNVLRARLFVGDDPAEALTQLNEFCGHMVPRAFATVIVARVDLGFRAGGGGVGRPSDALPHQLRRRPPSPRRSGYRRPSAPGAGTHEPSTFTLEPGHGLVIYSDGLVERRDATIDDGLERLGETLGHAGDASASWISTAMASSDTDDDVTIVTLRRL